jgi:hypothetical protein
MLKVKVLAAGDKGFLANIVIRPNDSFFTVCLNKVWVGFEGKKNPEEPYIVMPELPEYKGKAQGSAVHLSTEFGDIDYDAMRALAKAVVAEYHRMKSVKSSSLQTMF